MKEYTILGAGISGLGAKLRIGDSNCDVFDESNYIGGLCNSFVINGFTFDRAVHLSFSSNKEFREIFWKIPNNFIIPNPYNYYKKCWIKHPVQNNLFPLDPDTKLKIISGFLKRPKLKVKNYYDWLLCQYGRYFTDNFVCIYTKKYWTCSAKELSYRWAGKRMYKPDVLEVIKSSFCDNMPLTYYAKEMRYPSNGGFYSFIKGVFDFKNIYLNKKVISISLKDKKIFFSDNSSCSYNKLISSIPLNVIPFLINECPHRVRQVASQLKCSSVFLVSIGFNKVLDIPSLWFYVYDKDIPFARVYSPRFKSANNVPYGKDSLQCEIYYQGKINESKMIEKTKESLFKMGICKETDILFIDSKVMKNANVIFYKNMESKRKIILDYLKENEIISIGRFGRWDYFWSDQSFLSGYNFAQYLD